MMHLYSALLCIAVHAKRFTIVGGGVVFKSVYSKHFHYKLHEDVDSTLEV